MKIITLNNIYITKTNTNTSTKNNINFQGVIGEKLLKETEDTGLSVNKIKPSILGFFGVNTTKVDDVLESLCNKINSQSEEINNIKKQNTNLEKEIENLKSFQNTYYEYEKNNTQEILQEMKEIADENARLKIENKNLKQNIRILNFIPLDEMQVATPEEIIKTTEEMKKSKPLAEKSLYNYVISGAGQEEFLKFIANNNILVKARESDIQYLPEIAKIFDETEFGQNSAELSCKMLKDVLKNGEKGETILLPEIYEGIAIRSQALIGIFDDKSTNTEGLVDATLKNIVNFYNMVETNKKFLEKNGWVFERQNISRDKKEPFLSYSHSNEGSLLINLKDLAYGNFDKASRITPSGISKPLKLKIK